jgi:hypothetical protein
MSCTQSITATLLGNPHPTGSCVPPFRSFIAVAIEQRNTQQRFTARLLATAL